MDGKIRRGKLVYIASPYAGDVEKNIAFAKAACRYAMEQGCTPVAVHLIYPQLLNDSIPEEREMGIQMGLRVLKACDELWICGDRVSQGMQAEYQAAKALGMSIQYFTESEILMEGGCPVMEMRQC